MEKPSYTKQHSNICRSTRNMKQMHDFKVKVSSFHFTSNNLGDGDLMAAGFSWPPRSYICSFCTREFRSAQALGGHMNVHRRDKARLMRQSPARDGGQFPLLNLNFNLEPSPSVCPNPSFSFSPSSSPPLSPLVTKIPPFTCEIPPPSERRKCGGDRKPITTDLMKLKAAKGKRGFVCLELGIGLISPSIEELDLELRLGYN